jgi:hypothetical protein
LAYISLESHAFRIDGKQFARCVDSDVRFGVSKGNGLVSSSNRCAWIRAHASSKAAALEWAVRVRSQPPRGSIPGIERSAESPEHMQCVVVAEGKKPWHQFC